jgi:hypothetical protein
MKAARKQMITQELKFQANKAQFFWRASKTRSQMRQTMVHMEKGSKGGKTRSHEATHLQLQKAQRQPKKPQELTSKSSQQSRKKWR